MKLRFEFLFKYFLQHKALCSYFAVIPEIPQTAFLQSRPIPTSSGLEVDPSKVKVDPFKINIPIVNAPASTNKV